MKLSLWLLITHYDTKTYGPRHQLVVNGQLHAPAALHLGKESPVPVGYEAGWASAGLDVVEKRKSLASARNRTPVFQPVALSYNDWVIPYPVPYSRISVTRVKEVAL
jgi:hypothetical protein